MSDCMLISILSMSVELLEMLCAEPADALVPWARDLKTEDFFESLASNVCLQEVKFILNPVLLLCHFLWTLARLRLDEFAIASLLGFELSQVHFDSLTVGKPLPQETPSWPCS